MMGSDGSSRMRTYGVPLIVFLLYILLTGILTFVTHDAILTSFFSDAVGALAIGVFMWRGYRASKADGADPGVRFSAFGWLVILVAFAAMYVTSESVGNMLAVKFPVGVTDAYVEMSGRDLYLYVLLAVTVGPICEELLFRWLMFRGFRRRMPFWGAFAVSTALFTLIHGTLMHVPVTVALSLFLCILYEVTGRFRYCVIFHILFNYVGSTFIFAMETGYAAMCVAYAAMLAVLIFAYVFRDRVFGKYLRIGGLDRFEAYLDEKRMNFGKDDDKHDE